MWRAAENMRQKGLFDADRNRTTGLANARQTLQDFEAEAEAQVEMLAQLRKSAKRTLGAYPLLKGLLKSQSPLPKPAGTESARQLFDAVIERQKTATDTIAELRRRGLDALIR